MSFSSPSTPQYVNEYERHGPPVLPFTPQNTPAPVVWDDTGAPSPHHHTVGQYLVSDNEDPFHGAQGAFDPSFVQYMPPDWHHQVHQALSLHDEAPPAPYAGGPANSPVATPWSTQGQWGGSPAPSLPSSRAPSMTPSAAMAGFDAPPHYWPRAQSVEAALQHYEPREDEYAPP